MKPKEVLTYITGADLYKKYDEKHEHIMDQLENDDAQLTFGQEFALVKQSSKLRAKFMVTTPPILISRWTGVDAALKLVRAQLAKESQD